MLVQAYGYFFLPFFLFSFMHIFGKHAVREALFALSSEHPVGDGTIPTVPRIEKIHIAFSAEGPSVDEIRALARTLHVPCGTMDKRKFADLEKSLGLPAFKSQGVIAMISSVYVRTVSDLINESYAQTETPLLVVTDGITDPHNMGAIIRSAECAGAHGLIVSERNSAPLSGTVHKTSVGAVEYLPIAKAATASQALKDLKQAGFTIIGTDDTATAFYTDTGLYNDAVALVIGSEGEGMAKPVRDLCTTIIKIPLHGKVSSLNASVAAGIILFEIARQRG